jgi:hypothetical protein
MSKEKLNYKEIFPEVISIEEELDIPEVKVNVEVHFDTIESKGDKEDFVDDIHYIRTKLKNSIGQADLILNSLMKKIMVDDEISASDDNFPKAQYRYYEVSSTLLKSICDASKELINLHTTNVKTKREMDWEEKSIDNKEEVNNKRSGSLSDLLKNIKKEEEVNANKNTSE